MAKQGIIGGNGYRWRGRAIRTASVGGVTCATMPRRDSVIMVPCNVQSDTKYSVTVTASKSGGNGALLVNFFANKKYDGPPTPINVTSTAQKNYTITVTMPKIPASLPVYLRVWRPNDATGTTNVKTITYTPASKKPHVPRQPTVQKVNRFNPSPTAKKPKPKPKEKPKHNPIAVQRRQDTLKRKIKRKPRLSLPPKPKKKRSDVMKYKPYKKKTTTSMAQKVLVTCPEDVPKVSIITPTRDGVELLQKCYEAMKLNTYYQNWEWIIGDSASTDSTVATVKGWKDKRIKLVERKTTEGSFSSINNELVKYASGQYVLFLNDDTEPREFWLYHMMMKIHAYPDVGAVGARLMYNKKKVQHSGIAFIPQGPANIGHSVLKSYPKSFARYDRYFQAVTGACLLMRKADFDAVGGFDPIYHFCYEDVDLCLKVKHNLGKKVLYAANAMLYHAESVTQGKHKTAGPLQQAGIKEFKSRWMDKVGKDFVQYQKNMALNRYDVDISFVTCVHNLEQYAQCIGTLFKSKTNKNYEIIPIMNLKNEFNAAQALNAGIKRARADIVVLCHQDVLFYENWIDLLFTRINEIETKVTKKWGVLGTAGITRRDDTIGVVHNKKGNLQWQQTRRVKFGKVQTVDEHCMIIRKSSGLMCDPVTFDGFHFYGPDLCLSAEHNGYTNFGILCPLAHVSASGSLISGKEEFMRLLRALAKKWRPVFKRIRTPTALIRKKSIRSFVDFK